MHSDNENNSNLIPIKNCLNANKIKLWLPPFYCRNEGCNSFELENLATRFSSELNIPFEECLDCLKTLQSKALTNLKEKSDFQSTGVALIKVRISENRGQSRSLDVRLPLSETGEFLIENVSKAISIPKERLKIIFRGKILLSKESLNNQGLNHGVQVMVVVMDSNSDIALHEKHLQQIDSTKADVKLLAECDFDNEYLQVSDQSGKLLNLPTNEKKALILAMTLHEKGRVAMKSEDFSLALVMLLEAEKEFRKCNSEILNSVDNYGILNLDIVWCYLNLQCINQLPDAEHRLFQCESNFQKSYGHNFERLLALKGSAGNEYVLFVRMHLLQSIVYYHQNKLVDSKMLLIKVEEELQNLQIDDSLLSHMIELGYSEIEARLALRQSQGDLSVALDIVEYKREQRKANEEKAKRDRELARKRKKLGKCKNGEWVDPQFHKALMAMGHSHRAAQWALAQSCNSICDGLKLIEEHPESFTLSEDVPEELIEQVVNVGFDRATAKIALRKYNGDINRAVNELITKDGRLSDMSDGSDSDESKPSVSAKSHEEAYSRVSQGISRHEEDHLDLNLSAETYFLEKYKELLSKHEDKK